MSTIAFGQSHCTKSNVKKVIHSRKAEYWLSPAPKPIPAIPDLLYTGRYQARSAVMMTAHRHECLEICFIEKGLAEWWVGRKSYPISGGQFFFIRPHELHGGIDKIHQPCSYSFVGLDLSRRRLLELPAAEKRAIVRAIGRLPLRSVPAPIEAGRLFAGVLSANKSQDVLTIANARMSLVQILLSLISAGRSAKADSRSNVVVETIKLMEANIEHPLRLDELARRLGWSVSHLKSRFRSEMGLAPADYYLRLRINRAGAALRNSNDEITNIALQFGFSSSQYFATAFKHIVGQTPRDYRRQRR
jgi:AraC-like DNA-binding protein